MEIQIAQNSPLNSKKSQILLMTLVGVQLGVHVGLLYVNCSVRPVFVDGSLS